ncbi:MAG: glucohydrolase [Oscillospiraceae bacterium]|nr:glucohydrolase [Oscillospiraceae bacterium]
MYIVMDLVTNHCSDKHEWFQKALEDPYGHYGSYFYFRKGQNGNPPTNYRSYFGGSTWDPVPGTDDLYYLHMFAKEQPDLNWENPEVRQKLYEMVNWWLDKGVAGFRIDAIINIKKNLDFPSFAPDGPDGLVLCSRMVESANGIGTFLQELKKETFEKYDAFTVGEVFSMKKDELAEFIGSEGHFSTMFDFSAQALTFGGHGWYDAPTVQFDAWRSALFAAQQEVEGVGFLANIIENHDEPRGASRFLPDHARNEAGKKMLAATSLLLRGIPFLYQGQEIGMENCRMDDISQYEDINTIDQYQVAIKAGCTRQEALEACYIHSRDNARTPMQWSDMPNGGFTAGTPWFAVNPNYTHINVEEQQNRADSLLSWYKKLIALRKNKAHKETFVYGKTVPAFETAPGVLAYLRQGTDESILVAGNYGESPCTLPIQQPVRKVLLSNMEKEEAAYIQIKQQGCLTLESCECIVIQF